MTPDRIRTLALAIALPLLASCGTGDVTDSSEDARRPPPAAALAGGGISLEARLERLDGDLGAVLAGNLDDDARAHLLAAEAATDRLLEEEVGTEWLSTGYFVEARLRQIQALADRIVAELRRGVTRELILEDVASLRLAVRDLRQQLASQGNGPAPPPLDSLLAGVGGDGRTSGAPTSGSSGSTTTSSEAATTTAEPRAAPAGGPLGEPIQP